MNQSYRNARPSITARPERASWDSALPQEQTVAAVGEHVGGRVGAGVGRGSGAPKSRRHRHTEQEWNELRDIITHMYIEKDKKAEEVVDFLSTQHNFKVGLRKFKDWLKNNGISKNVHKSDMLTLYAKRRARMIAGGKKTIVYKDGRVLEDSRLDRFGERYYLDAGLSAYVEAETPYGYTYATPGPTFTDEHWSTSCGTSLRKLFNAQRNVQAIFGHVTDPAEHTYTSSHIHQVGVFGLRATESPRSRPENLPLLLKKCLLLARDIMSVATSSSTDHMTDPFDSQAPTQSTSKFSPKFYITFTGGSNDMFNAQIQQSVLSYLMNSETCSQLLDLDLQDRSRRKQGYYPMTSDEQSEYKDLLDTLFGLPTEFNGAMSFMHVNLLIASLENPADMALMRLSLGLDIRDVPDCTTCQRRVVSIDCFSPTGAVQVNVPLRTTWVREWEPDQILASQGTESIKWSECVYSLRGWFIHSSSSLYRWFHLHSEGLEDGDSICDDGNGIWEERWDPMNVSATLETFQPHDVSVPAPINAYYEDFDMATSVLLKREESPQFDFETFEDDVWDP